MDISFLFVDVGEKPKSFDVFDIQFQFSFNNERTDWFHHRMTFKSILLFLLIISLLVHVNIADGIAFLFFFIFLHISNPSNPKDESPSSPISNYKYHHKNGAPKIAICTVYAYSLGVKLMTKFTPFAINLTVNLEPVYGIILAVIILGKVKWSRDSWCKSRCMYLFISHGQPINTNVYKIRSCHKLLHFNNTSSKEYYIIIWSRRWKWLLERIRNFKMLFISATWNTYMKF